MKSAKISLLEHPSKRSGEAEWLNEGNSLARTRVLLETLDLYDYLEFDGEVYPVTELSLRDL